MGTRMVSMVFLFQFVMWVTQMIAEDLIELLEEHPFKPLRLRLSECRTYEIRHPEMAIVTPTVVAIGLSKGNGSRLAERITNCSIAHIVELEPLEAAR